MHKKNIIWLASYPKSGNTWFRVFLTNLLSNSESPANINDLAETTISSSRRVFDEYTGLSSSDLTFHEIDNLRPEVYKMQSQESEEILFKKVHDKFQILDEGKLMFPKEISKGVIYIIRNPLDVLVSFAYHNAKSVHKMLPLINDSNHALCDNKNKLINQLRQFLGSWSDHVKSWTEQNFIPVHVIRYEDMLNHPFNSFKKATEFINLNKSGLEIQDAIKKSSFSILSKQEKEKGFREKMIKSKSFFRKGGTGDWRLHLDKKEENKIIQYHKNIMKKFEYLDINNKPVF